MMDRLFATEADPAISADITFASLVEFGRRATGRTIMSRRCGSGQSRVQEQLGQRPAGRLRRREADGYERAHPATAHQRRRLGVGDLLSEARRDLGCHLLTDPAIDIDEVVCLLDYQDTTSFYRAFHE